MRFDQISAALLNSAGRLCTIPGNISIPIFYKINCSLPCKIALCKATPFGASFLSVPQAIQCPPCSLTDNVREISSLPQQCTRAHPHPPVHLPHYLCFWVLIKSPSFLLGPLLAFLTFPTLPSFLAQRT